MPFWSARAGRSAATGRPDDSFVAPDCGRSPRAGDSEIAVMLREVAVPGNVHALRVGHMQALALGL